MTDASKHIIKTVMDIVALPAEKREACCHDLVRWCALHDLASAIGGDVEPYMTWVDDGEHNAKILVETKPI